MAALITKAQFEARLGPAVVARFYDDNGDGVPDTASIQQLLEDASSKVRGALGPVYSSVLLTAANSAESSELRRITLDVAVAMAAQRHSGPTVFDWRDLMEQADRDLKALRIGMASLGGVAAPEPAANQGVRISSGNPAYPDTFPVRFSDDWGRF